MVVYPEINASQLVGLQLDPQERGVPSPSPVPIFFSTLLQISVHLINHTAIL